MSVIEHIFMKVCIHVCGLICGLRSFVCTYIMGECCLLHNYIYVRMQVCR